MKRLFLVILSVALLISVPFCQTVAAEEVKEINAPFDVDAKSAVLMDYNTGTILYEKNADEALPPASVTKIMTLLLIMEAIDQNKLSYDDMISVSEYAASMGGSQVFLEAGESMRTDEFLKSIIIASANDAAVAMAEAVAGSESAFVDMMNKKAAELGMANTHFENPTGLDDDTTGHLTSARDIALMSRELMKHEKIFEYTTVWMDSIRDGAFGLTNTNRLIRFYNGATGLKTGSTGKAGFCISATAKRDDLHLIAVIMGSETRDIRNEAAKKLLDYGFANYSIYKSEAGVTDDIKIDFGTVDSAKGCYPECELLVPKGETDNIKVNFEVPERVSAPLRTGDSIGKVTYTLGDKVIAECEITVSEDVPKLSFFGLFKRLLGGFILK